MVHEAFEVKLAQWPKKAVALKLRTAGERAESTVGRDAIVQVLARVARAAPHDISRLEIHEGDPRAARRMDRLEIPQATVSKAVKVLLDAGYLEYGATLHQRDRRPTTRLKLSSRLVTAGVHVALRDGRPAGISIVLTSLDGTTQLLGHRRVSWQAGLPGDAAPQEESMHWIRLASEIASVIRQLMERHGRVLAENSSTFGGPQLDRGAGNGRIEATVELFGVGVEVAAPVDGDLVIPLLRDGSAPPQNLGGMLREHFDPQNKGTVPILIENDINALAVHAIQWLRYQVLDLIVIGVFEHGTGGGLVMDGRVRRGSSGRAMEVGHLAVGRLSSGESPRVVPNMVCLCGDESGRHVDLVGSPMRILRELGCKTLDEAVLVDTDQAARVFEEAGAVLGWAIQCACTTTDPATVILYLPQPLAEASPGTAAAGYLEAARREISAGFTGPRELMTRTFPTDDQNQPNLRATAAAKCVLEGFLEHALELDECALEG
ncbi:ROK family transcriptional regulator [Nocardia blacklockiae]|uniref:ROK family transcriptional regulator n=1 Tax=Nocardia blacklockiae TaxID=480036 RepID=UPI0018962393|nr:ROK family protein [Nocardia blacklockiae]MBF6170096.1 ROK family protein [Nocardia blacklockiae]